MKHCHEIDLGQWPPRLVIITDKRAYHRFMRTKCGGAEAPPFPVQGGGHAQKLTNGSACYFLIAVSKQPSRDELACTLAHEATHVMRWLLEFVGEAQPGTETECYLVEHIVRQGLAAIA